MEVNSVCTYGSRCMRVRQYVSEEPHSCHQREAASRSGCFTLREKQSAWYCIPSALVGYMLCFSSVVSATDTGLKGSWVDPTGAEVTRVKVINEAGNQTHAE